MHRHTQGRPTRQNSVGALIYIISGWGRKSSEPMCIFLGWGKKVWVQVHPLVGHTHTYHCVRLKYLWGLWSSLQLIYSRVIRWTLAILVKVTLFHIVNHILRFCRCPLPIDISISATNTRCCSGWRHGTHCVHLKSMWIFRK